MAGRAAARQRYSGAGLPIDAKKSRRRQVQRHQDGARRNALLPLARQYTQHAVAQVSEVSATGAKILILRFGVLIDLRIQRDAPRGLRALAISDRSECRLCDG